jgi:uncharacterized tellurite resistance protein B-like protein
MKVFAFLVTALAAIPAAAQTPAASGSTTPLALFALLVVIVGWFGLRTIVRSLRAGKTEAAVRGNFADFARQALVNAAKIDGRIAPSERTAMAAAMKEIAGEELDGAAIDAAFARASLSKDELIAYLNAKSGAFTRDQKVALLRALLSIFLADGRFDEAEHHALVDYTAAIGFDRQSAPEFLRGLSRQVAAGNII